MDIKIEKSVKSLLGECLRKKRMPSGYADSVIQKAALTGVLLYKYRCPYCQKWHVTKMENHQKRT